MGSLVRYLASWLRACINIYGTRSHDAIHYTRPPYSTSLPDLRNPKHEHVYTHEPSAPIAEPFQAARDANVLGAVGDGHEEHIATAGPGELVVRMERVKQAWGQLLRDVAVRFPRLMLLANEEVLPRRQHLIDNHKYTNSCCARRTC